MSLTLTPAIQTHQVKIRDGSTELMGDLAIPANAKGVIVLAHGSGSHRYSRFNGYIAQQLHQIALATLLINLLTPDEAAADMRSQHYRFDVRLLSLRLARATEWLLQNRDTHGLKIGYFCANAESAAALVAAANQPDRVHAIVSRSGRVDLAGSAVSSVMVPTLLLVGGDDFACIGMNQDAFAQLQGVKQMEIIPGATHLFEEPETLEQAIRLAIRWFMQYVSTPPR